MSAARLVLFRKSLMASAMSAAVLAGGAALAQSNGGAGDAQEIEVVTVVGVRGSLLRSMDMKQRAATIVDAISSEELGKFPDRNVADSLGNVPGVTVSRGAGGEGQTVTIRGLGEEFTTTTLNGRILPTDSSSRAFAFDVLPSEMISGAEVRKAVEASQLEGSLGGAIDLHSARPFDNKGLHLSGSVEGEYDDLPGQMGYKVTGVYSDTFLNDRLGVLVSLSYARRHVRTDNLHEYSPVQVTESDDNVDYNRDGVIGGDTSYIRPDYYSNGVILAKFQRLGLSTSIQYQVNNDLQLTFDALFSYYNATTNNYAQSNFLAPREDPTSPNLKWDLSTLKIDKNNVVTGFSMNDLVAEVLVDREPRLVRTYQYGGHATWTPSAHLSVDVDAYWAKASHNEAGKNYWVVSGVTDTSATFATRSGGLPDLAITLSDGRPFSEATNSDYRPHYIGIQGDNVHDEITGTQFDAKYTTDLGILEAVQFGANFSQRNKGTTTIDNARTTSCSYCGYPFTFADIGADVVRPLSVSNVLSGMKGNFPRTFGVFDVATYLKALSKADANPNILDPTTGQPYPAGYSQQVLEEDKPLSFAISERNVAGYVQADFAGESWHANAGLRVVSTHVSSNGSSLEIISITKIPGNTADYDVDVSDPTPVHGGGTYTKLLPSANFSYDFSEDLRLRLAASQVIARPSFDQLSPASDASSAASGTFIIYNSGNPDLKPTKANQFDASLEWYKSQQGSVSLAFFYKDVKDFVTTVNSREEIAGYDFTVVKVLNGDSAKIYGAELAGQYMFDNGFGAQANVTYNHSRAKLGDVTGDLDGAIPFSYNLKVFYEKDGWESQISYNHTSKFTSRISGAIPGLPEKQLAYDEMTASLSYQFTENFKGYVEGSNLLDSATQRYSAYKNVPAYYENYGRSIFFGVRAKL